MFPKFTKTVGILSLCIVAVLLARVFVMPVLRWLYKHVQMPQPRIDTTSSEHVISFIQKYYVFINIGVLLFSLVAFVALRVYRNEFKEISERITTAHIIILLLVLPVIWIYAIIFSHLTFLHNPYAYAAMTAFALIVAWILVRRSRAPAASAPTGHPASEPEVAIASTASEDAPNK